MVVSLPPDFFVGRMNKQICEHGNWTTRSIAVLKPSSQGHELENHKAPDQQILSTSCKRFAQPRSVATTSSRLWTKQSLLGGTHHRAPIVESSLWMPKTTLIV